MVDACIFKHMEQGFIGQKFDFDNVFSLIKWNQDGLIPAITQDSTSKEVLMLAWVNAEALTETLTQQQVCYWSRSRQCLWRKGESSGHRQFLVEARLDCDGDSILFLVRQHGPACHTNRPSCFYLGIGNHQITILSESIL